MASHTKRLMGAFCIPLTLLGCKLLQRKKEKVLCSPDPMHFLPSGLVKLFWQLPQLPLCTAKSRSQSHFPALSTHHGACWLQHIGCTCDWQLTEMHVGQSSQTYWGSDICKPNIPAALNGNHQPQLVNITLWIYCRKAALNFAVRLNLYDWQAKT